MLLDAPPTPTTGGGGALREGADGAINAAVGLPDTTAVHWGVSSSSPRRTATLCSSSFVPNGVASESASSRRYSMALVACIPSVRRSFSMLFLLRPKDARWSGGARRSSSVSAMSQTASSCSRYGPTRTSS